MAIEIPWAKPDFWGREETYMLDALRSTWISGGAYVDRLEREFCTLTSCRYALAVCNGTAALHLAYLGLGIHPGDEIIVPAFGFQGAANVAVQFGAIPVFTEVDPQTWCMTGDQIAPHITSRTRAIVAIHTYGNVCDMDPILRVATEHGIPLIEDTAEALGSTYRGREAGSFGTIGTYSFQATKTITCGEGGMVVTSDEALADVMRNYRSHGLKRIRHYWHEVPGNNFRLANPLAALAVAQFESIGAIRETRERMRRMYDERLAHADGVQLQSFATDVQPLVWAYAVRLDPHHFPQGRDAVMRNLAERGIETRPGFVCPSRMPHIHRCPSRPVSEDLSDTIISLPSFASLREPEIDRICSALLAERQVP